MMTKKLVSLFLCATMILGIASTVIAYETSLSKEELYTLYGKIVEDVGKQYGIEISLQPIATFNENKMLTPGEFKADVEKNCKILNNLPNSHESITLPYTKGTEIYRYSNTEFKADYGVTVEFEAAINVLQHPETKEYFIENFTAFKPTATSAKPNVSAVVDDYYSKIIDGGRTNVVKADLTLTVDGVDYKKRASAFYYLNKKTGKITIQSY